MLIEEVADIIGPDVLASLMRSKGRKLALDREPQVVDEARIVQHMNQAGYGAEAFFSYVRRPDADTAPGV